MTNETIPGKKSDYWTPLPTEKYLVVATTSGHSPLEKYLGLNGSQIPFLVTRYLGGKPYLEVHSITREGEVWLTRHVNERDHDKLVVPPPAPFDPRISYRDLEALDRDVAACLDSLYGQIVATIYPEFPTLEAFHAVGGWMKSPSGSTWEDSLQWLIGDKKSHAFLLGKTTT